MTRPSSRTTLAARPAEPAPDRDARRRLEDARARLGRSTRGVSATSPLVDAGTAAQLLGVPPSWLLTQARARNVPHHKLGHYVRFDIDELIDWLDETRVDPGPPSRRR